MDKNKIFSGGPYRRGRFFKKAPLAAEGILILSIIILLLHIPAPAVEKTIVRPSFEELHSLIVKGWSLMKKGTRKKAASAIKTLDAHHSGVLKKNGFSTPPPPALNEHIKARTGNLPGAVPMCERTIIFSLYLQLDMLDAVLKIKDSEKAAELKEKRSRKRLLHKDNSIYGDYRDVYFYLVIDTLKDISELHRCLGVEGNTRLSFPRGLKKADVQSYILTKIESVSKQAEQLSLNE